MVGLRKRYYAPAGPMPTPCGELPHDRGWPTIVLGIETSCDETGVGIVRGDGTTLLADEVASSVDEHARFGGVVPEVASRAHLEAMVPDRATGRWRRPGSPPATSTPWPSPRGPGSRARCSSASPRPRPTPSAWDVPLYGVNHLAGHVASSRHPSELDEWYDMGVRLIGPAWVGTRYCGGWKEPCPLTDDGRELLSAMADYNFILDLSHMDEHAAIEALDIYRSHCWHTCQLRRTHAECQDEPPFFRPYHRGYYRTRWGGGFVPLNTYLKVGWLSGKDPRKKFHWIMLSIILITFARSQAIRSTLVLARISMAALACNLSRPKLTPSLICKIWYPYYRHAATLKRIFQISLVITGLRASKEISS